MSITNTALITDALREIGVIDETEAPSAEQGDDALRKLNQMMVAWEAAGVPLEYFTQTALSDTCPIPDFAEYGVTCALAIRLAPTYGATVSPELSANAARSYQIILRDAMTRALPEAELSNLPGFGGQPWDINSGP